MRTITENLLNRLIVQAEEAEVRGLSKLAGNLTEQINSSSIRKDDANYSYSENEFRKDINDQLWSSIVRTADFYGIKRFDAYEMNQLVEKTAEDFVKSIRLHAGITHGVGAYEPSIPGEEKASIEVEE